MLVKSWEKGETNEKSTEMDEVSQPRRREASGLQNPAPVFPWQRRRGEEGGETRPVATSHLVPIRIERWFFFVFILPFLSLFVWFYFISLYSSFNLFFSLNGRLVAVFRLSPDRPSVEVLNFGTRMISSAEKRENPLIKRADWFIKFIGKNSPVQFLWKKQLKKLTMELIKINIRKSADPKKTWINRKKTHKKSGLNFKPSTKN